MTTHVPHRQCAGCGRRRPQVELTRVVVVAGRAAIDRERRMGGRGAYLCPAPECARRAARKGSLARRLRRPATGLAELTGRLAVEPRGGECKDSPTR